MEDALEPGVKKAGIERSSLQALIYGCILFALAGFFGLKVVVAAINLAPKWLP